MKITILGSGTSQGIPVIACDCEVCQSTDEKDKRLRPSIMVETEGKTFIVDTGPDFRQQMLREKVQRIDAVIFTHQHKDHTAGFDDVRSFNFKQKIDIPIYARKMVMDQLKQEFSYIFVDKALKYPGVLNVESHLIDNRKFTVAGIKILPIEVMHHRLPVFGFRFGDFTYLTDLNFISDAELSKVQGSRFLVLDALQKQKHISHFNLEEALETVHRLDPLPEKTYLTHIGHRMGKHADVMQELPPYVELAYDGLVIEL